MTSKELQSIVERAGGTFSRSQFDNRYTVMVSIRYGGRAFIYRYSEEYGDTTYATDRLYQAMVLDGIVSDDSGAFVNHFVGE